MLKYVLTCCLIASHVLIANSSLVNAQSIHLNWSKDSSKAWFYSKQEHDAKSFYIVDVKKRSRERAFDETKLADALSKELGDKITSSTLSVDRIRFADAENQLYLKIKQQYWLLDLSTYRITKTKLQTTQVSEASLFLPPRKSGSSDESTEITIENKLKTPIETFWMTNSGGERSYGTIKAGESRSQHTYVDHVWLIKSNNGKALGCFAAKADDHITIDQLAISNLTRGESHDKNQQHGIKRLASNRDQSPDRKWKAFIRDNNLWVRNGDDEKQLSHIGSQDNSFAQPNNESPDVRWSPDSKYLVAFQTKRVPDHTVHFIESSPADQLQPKLHSYSYRKPGDELPTKSVHLFSIQNMEQIPVSDELCRNPWSLRFSSWDPSSDHFYLHYNQRGHQVIRLLEVRTTDGNVRSLIDETSKTFLQYSAAGKAVFEDLNADEILWASERSGWNHLYRYVRSTGKVRNAVTSGNWNVKRIDTIDRKSNKIWFFAVGVHQNQDPYHEHFCCVDFDGSNFKVLTKGDGTHKISREQDGQYFLDTYSRIDLAPITELRESESGELICELSRKNTQSYFKKRRLTERFVAKGRDGKTDIWGIIHWPVDFDPNKKYPVVENIYAGPHDQHVPKAFRSRFGHQHRIADAGMIVVQIDGMGTAWRSKEFHDVCYKNLRDAGFPDRIAWMKAAAKKHPQMDLTRVGIYGGSAGGQNAMAALLWHNDFYKVAVSDCGCHDNRMDKIWWNEQWMGWPVDESYAQNSNMENAHFLKGKLMLLVGELDRNVDPASTTQVVKQLIKHNKDFEFVFVAGAGHGSAETPWASRKRLNFLKQHLLSE